MIPTDRIRILTILLVCAAVCVLGLPQRAGRAENENVLRLHVLANSDSPTDQAVKLQVRDAILDSLAASESAADAEAYLLENGATLLQRAEATLREAGMDYGVQLVLGEFDFPDRSYGERAFPAGRYRALRVILGDGAGQNWWCVLFPPLCIVTNGTQPLPDADEIRFESTILNWLRGKGATK